MKVVCAWCGRVKRKGKGPVSHGICEKCARKLIETRYRSAGKRVEKTRPALPEEPLAKGAA